MGRYRVDAVNTNEYGSSACKAVVRALRIEISRLDATLAGVDSTTTNTTLDRLFNERENLDDILWDLEHRQSHQSVILGSLFGEASHDN